jgi:hypothetical protein
MFYGIAPVKERTEDERTENYYCPVSNFLGVLSWWNVHQRNLHVSVNSGVDNREFIINLRFAYWLNRNCASFVGSVRFVVKIVNSRGKSLELMYF